MTGFHSLLPPGFTIVALIVVSASLLWLEWRRKLRFRALRIIAVFVMVTAFAGIILRPTYPAETSSEILLLTPGFNQTVVDSLLKSNPGLRIQHTPNTAPYKGSTALNSYRDLLDIQDELRFIAGQGLPAYALEMIDRASFNFYPGEMPPGVTSLFLPDGIKQHHRQRISGTFNNTSGKKRIFLNNAGGKEDSIVIGGIGNYPFELSFTPRQQGDLLYPLVVVDSLGRQTSEHIPLHVEATAPLDILFVQGYPTFETQYLKTFLSQKHHKLALRYQVSQQVFRYEYANRPAIPLSRLTKSLLDEFDLLILDDDALQKLSSSEKTLIRASVREGLGLLIVSPSKDAGFLPELKSVQTDTTVLRIGSSSVALPASSVRAIATPGWQPVTQNASGILSGYAYSGSGKVAFQLLKETYRLTLSGDSMSYSALWTPLIEGTAKRHIRSTSIKIKNQFPYYTDEPLRVDLISAEEIPELSADSIQLPLLEDVLIDDVWHATLWADDPGWHTLFTNGGSRLSYYVAPDNGWKTLSTVNQMNNTTLTKNDSSTLSITKTSIEKEIPLLFFFLAFLLSAGFLWLVPKL